MPKSRHADRVFRTPAASEHRVASAATTLRATASSAGAARRFVNDVLVNRGMERVADVAALLTSELVTNAIIHARSPVHLDLVMFASHVRVEVRDLSPAPPARRRDRPLAAVPGRGLELVEALANRWGAHVAPGGKCVWFELGGWPDGEGPDRQEVLLRDVPAASFVALNLHIDQLLHELQILAAGRGWHPASVNERMATLITKAVGRYSAARSSAWRQAEEATRHDRPRLDITVQLPTEAAMASVELLTVLEDADELCASGELLTLPVTDEMWALRRWVTEQMWDQLRSGEPYPGPWGRRTAP